MDKARHFSIGHSNHDVDRFLQLLRGAAITAIADVRSSPFSKRHPVFNRPELESILRESEIGYAFLGDLLGGRPRDLSLYDAEGRVDYERVRQTAAFQRGIERLLQGSQDYRVALLCAEEDPLDCHRGLMIAPALVERGISPAHVRGDGSVETTKDMEERLLAETKVGEGILDGLFAATVRAEERNFLLAEAYRFRAGQKAFQLKPMGQTPAPTEGDSDPGNQSKRT